MNLDIIFKLCSIYLFLSSFFLLLILLFVVLYDMTKIYVCSTIKQFLVKFLQQRNLSLVLLLSLNDSSHIMDLEFQFMFGYLFYIHMFRTSYKTKVHQIKLFRIIKFFCGFSRNSLLF